jgi:sugar lactone lactonase YvrE
VSGLTVSDGRILAMIGATPQEVPPSVGNGGQAGRLISVNPADGTWRTVAQVGKADYNFTLKFTPPTPGVFSPGTQEHDANPYGVLAAGDGAYVADAGANTLDFVDAGGKVTILNHFEWRDPNPNNFPNDIVPTCVAKGADALWVGQLSGRLLKVAGSSVTPIVPKDSSGHRLLTHVTNCISGGDGNLYFVNMFGPGIPFTSPSFFVGNVVKYNVLTGKGSVVAGNLSFPNMAAIGPDGNLYVTTGSICPANGASPVPPPAPNPCVGGGKVLRINLH